MVEAPNVHIDEELEKIDHLSRMGRFGWPENSTDEFYGIPYILRNSIKYFAVEMILMKQPIRSYFSRIQPVVYEYYYSIKEHATQAECHLLNEINIMHCDMQFGKKPFTTESFIIKVTDAYALYEFLETCFKALSFSTKTLLNKIGFIQFSFSGIFIPYVTVNNDQYMPLCCFSNTNNTKVDFISGWDLAYLRFCCLYQGIWKGSNDFFAVLSLSSMMANLPIDTQFATCWPSSDHGLFRKTLSITIEPIQSVIFLAFVFVNKSTTIPLINRNNGIVQNMEEIISRWKGSKEMLLRYQ